MAGSVLEELRIVESVTSELVRVVGRFYAGISVKAGAEMQQQARVGGGSQCTVDPEACNQTQPLGDLGAELDVQALTTGLVALAASIVVLKPARSAALHLGGLKS